MNTLSYPSGHMVHKLLQAGVVLCIVAGLTACGTLQTSPTYDASEETAAHSRKNLGALQQLIELEEEIKKLRSAVEEMQFDIYNMQGRQQDLYRDLDRRMSEIERNQVAITGRYIEGVSGEGTVPTEGSVENGSISGDAVVAKNNDSAQSSASELNHALPQQSNVSSDMSANSATQSVSVVEQKTYDQAFDLLKRSRYAEAIEVFRKLSNTWPQSQLADDALYWMSEAYYINRNFEQALNGFRNIVSRYPNSQRVPDALLKIGYVQYDIGAYQKAAATFRDILSRFPGHQITVAAKTRLRQIERVAE